jgi:hypothetical protein
VVSAAATTPEASPVSFAGIMGCRSSEATALVETTREASVAVIIDQAEDLRRRLIEQEALVRAEADLHGVPAARVEASLTSTRAAAHALETISGAVGGELEQQRWVARHVARFAVRLIESALEQLQSRGAARVPTGTTRSTLSVSRPRSRS